jgi:hypothetical protein
MLAKRFFNICAGILCLSLAYHFGAVSAGAQGGLTVEGASIESFQLNTFPRATGCVNRLWRWMEQNGALRMNPVPVPGTERIVATDPYGSVMLENGDWLQFDGSAWVLVGNIVGAPTPATQETWGQLKARYRADAPGAPQDK